MLCTLEENKIRPLEAKQKLIYGYITILKFTTTFFI